MDSDMYEKLGPKLNWNILQVYFLATAEGQPGSQHLFRLAVDQTDSAPECLSCGHSEDERFKYVG